MIGLVNERRPSSSDDPVRLSFLSSFLPYSQKLLLEQIVGNGKRKSFIAIQDMQQEQQQSTERAKKIWQLASY
jgi:hypothetical protein